MSNLLMFKIELLLLDSLDGPASAASGGTKVASLE
jgi:hypothetical protein